MQLELAQLTPGFVVYCIPPAIFLPQICLCSSFYPENEYIEDRHPLSPRKTAYKVVLPLLNTQIIPTESLCYSRVPPFRHSCHGNGVRADH